MLRDSARNPLQMQNGLDPVEVDAAIYGGSGRLNELSGRIVARPTPISQIWADIRQPRRAVPSSVRGKWTGDPALVADLLAHWEEQADKGTAGQSINTMEIIMGNGEGLDMGLLPAIAREWVALARLAASIREEGLINPISIVQIEGCWLIESGERRWLAYHLLTKLGFDGFAVIPAIRVDGREYVWRQARENTARRQLNAIGMARQFALLVMAAREEADQFRYESYEKCVPEGGCDRCYYAQVADGNIHRIPRGMAEKIQSAMGLGKEQISQYRDLLALTGDDLIDDEIWVRADIESWPERAMRNIKDRYPPHYLRKVMSQPGWQLDDLREKPQVTAAPDPPSGRLTAVNLTPVSSPPQSATKFKPGDMTEANGIPSRIEKAEFQRGIAGYVVWQPNLQRRTWYAESALKLLGCTWDEWLASKGGPNLKLPAVSPSSAALGSDKRDSQVPVVEQPTGRLFEIGAEDGRWSFLQALRVVAEKSGHQAAADVFYALAGLKKAEIPSLLRDDPELLELWKAQIGAALNEWLMMLNEIVFMVEEAGR